MAQPPTVLARFKASFDEADRIQSEVGIRFCRPPGAVRRCPFTPLSSHGTTGIIHAPRTPGSGRQKAAAAILRPSLALEKQDSIRARAGSPSKVVSFGRPGPGAGAASCIPWHHHAAATSNSSGTTAGRRVVVFPAPAYLLGC